MPPVLGGGKFAGLNARWRLYRYTTGNVYRPHVDGAWPGSGERRRRRVRKRVERELMGQGRGGGEVKREGGRRRKRKRNQ